MGYVGKKDVSVDYSFPVNVLTAGRVTVMQLAKGHLGANNVTVL